jgi:hypothetical protein
LPPVVARMVNGSLHAFHRKQSPPSNCLIASNSSSYSPIGIDLHILAMLSQTKNPPAFR